MSPSSATDPAFGPPPTPMQRVRAAGWLLGVLLLLVGCLGGVGYGVYYLVWPDEGPKGPSDQPAQSLNDLAKLCNGVYYPQSPAYTGPGPHPIHIEYTDSFTVGTGSMISMGLAPGTPDNVRRAWSPRSEDTAVVQLVACVDRVDSGSKVATCSFTDPKPASVKMEEGIYELKLHEVATGKLVATTRINGAEKTCPLRYDIGRDPGIYSKPSREQFLEALKPHVEN